VSCNDHISPSHTLSRRLDHGQLDLSVRHKLCRLCFKGSLSQSAVLCTSSKTFAVKNVETTNLVMLVDDDILFQAASPTAAPPVATNTIAPSAAHMGFATQQSKVLRCSDAAIVVHNVGPLKCHFNRRPSPTVCLQNADAAAHPPIVVIATVSSHLELVPTAPNLDRLDELLADRPYGADGVDEDDAEPMQHDGATPITTPGSGPPGVMYEQLIREVQASALELDAGLKQRGAVCLDGRWRGVDRGYLGTILELVMLTAVEQGWRDWTIPAADAAAALAGHGYLPELVRHCLTVYGHEVTDGIGVYRLDETAVCLYFAHQTLAAQPQWDSVEGFMASWQGRLPEVSLILYNSAHASNVIVR
jgi:sister chromatid cohesion protein DCC1